MSARATDADVIADVRKRLDASRCVRFTRDDVVALVTLALASRAPAVPVGLAELLEAVARARGFVAADLTGGDRTADVSRARLEFCWLARQRRVSLEAIGVVLAGRSRQAVHQAVRKVQRLVDAIPAYGEELLAMAADVPRPAWLRSVG